MNNYHVFFTRNHFCNDDLQKETIQVSDLAALHRIYAQDYCIDHIILIDPDPLTEQERQAAELANDANWLGYNDPQNVDFQTDAAYGQADLENISGDYMALAKGISVKAAYNYELLDVCATDPEHIAFSTGNSILDKGFRLLKLAVREQLPDWFVEAQAQVEDALDWTRTRESDRPQ